MRNNKWMKIFGLALAASLVVIGCENNSDDQTLGNVPTDTGGTGGSGTGTVGGGTSGGSAGLTGATVVGSGGGGGGGGSSSGTGTGTSTGTSGTGTSTGTSGGATAAVPFNNRLQPTPAVSLTGLNNPTQVVRLNNTVFILDGFGLGNNGRLQASTVTITNGVPTFSTPVRITARTPESNVSDTLANPYGLATNGTDLFLSVGFGSFGNGAIIKVSNISAQSNGQFVATYENITDTLTGTGAGSTAATANPVNPAFMLVGTVDGSEYVYWSEYTQQNSSGGVRRIRTSPSATETADTIVNGLNFPAGLATDGTNLIIADSGGGQASIGQVIRVPVSFPTGTVAATPTTINGAASNNVVGVVTGDQAISRPFDVVYDGNTGFFFTEGNAIANSSLGSLGQSAGTVRYLPSSTISSTAPGTARVVVDSVTNGAGLDVVSLGGGNVGVLYTESVSSPNGRVMRAVVSTANPQVVTPNQVDTGLNLPLDTAIISPTVPIFSAVVGYNAAQANGLLNVYAP